VWLRLPFTDCAALLPALARRGFLPHHAERGGAHLVLQAWLPRAAPNPTPPHAHVDVGCGALVVNARGQLLGIRERYDEEQRWGVPGGHLDPGEDWLTCAAREAREETGVACVALGIVGVHETHMPWSRPPPAAGAAPPSDAQVGGDEHALRWGTTHQGVYVLCYALGEGALNPDPSEVAQAAWMDAKDWRGLPAHVRALVASAEATGHLAAAARAAAQGAPGAVPAQGLLTASALPLPSRHGGAHGHVFYHAAPPDVFAQAAAGAGLGAPQRLLREASGAGGGASGSEAAAAAGSSSSLKLLGPPQHRAVPAAGASARAGLRLAPALGLAALGAGLLGLGYAAGKGQLQLPPLFTARASMGR
jgi:ADP-ribose pyrophosphatase YjhB (NUDIX family)